MRNNKYCIIYLVRHGQTEWNIKGLLQGQMDSPLTKNGIRQAKSLAKKLNKIKFDYVFSSDLARAKKTADLIAKEHNLITKTVEALRERNFKSLEGRKFLEVREELKEMFNEMENLDGEKRAHFKIKDEETDNEIATRLITYLREIAIAFPSKNILMVSHGGIMRAFLIHIGFAKYNEFPHGAIKNTSYVKIRTDGIDFFVEETSGIEKLVSK